MLLISTSPANKITVIFLGLKPSWLSASFQILVTFISVSGRTTTVASSQTMVSFSLQFAVALLVQVPTTKATAVIVNA